MKIDHLYVANFNEVEPRVGPWVVQIMTDDTGFNSESMLICRMTTSVIVESAEKINVVVKKKVWNQFLMLAKAVHEDEKLELLNKKGKIMQES
jgi:hypothetical protein